MLDEDSLPACVGWCGGKGKRQGVKIAEEKVASEVGGREGFLIDDVERQRLNEELAPCLN